MKTDDLLDDIAACTVADEATDNFQYLAYLVEEVGEVATCIAVEQNLKNKKLKEGLFEECCDVLAMTLAIIVRNQPHVSWDDIKAQMSKKVDRWLERTKQGL